MSSTVLIVDDEESGRQTIESVLEGEGYNMVMAENGFQAIEKARSLLPDVILLDVMMPGMTGFEVCQRIRSDPQLAEIPIIILTALDDRESMLSGLKSGADDFISKPFDRFELRAPPDLERATLLRNTWTPWVRWFRAVGLNWPEPASGPMFDDSPLMLRAALDGQGVALGRHWLAVDELRAGTLVAPFRVAVRDDFQYWLAWPTGRAANPDAVLFRTWLQAQAAAEPHPCPLDQVCSTDQPVG